MPHVTPKPQALLPGPVRVYCVPPSYPQPTELQFKHETIQNHNVKKKLHRCGHEGKYYKFQLPKTQGNLNPQPAEIATEQETISALSHARISFVAGTL